MGGWNCWWREEREREEGTQTNPVGLYHVEINREGRTSKKKRWKEVSSEVEGKQNTAAQRPREEEIKEEETIYVVVLSLSEH